MPDTAGFGIAHLVIPGVIDITLEMSNYDRNGEPLLAKRIAEINAEIRFKHKITKPQWEIRQVGDSSAAKPKRRPKQAAKQTPAPAPPEVKQAEQKTEQKPRRPGMSPAPRRLPKPAPVEREGSIEGQIDLAAARRLARS